ncbi:MAG: hypothetical protein H6739_17960 [Alphaproteobacteria bacterium]|nr:hypothetical protein [Alphaproteobacteria bacterium]
MSLLLLLAATAHAEELSLAPYTGATFTASASKTAFTARYVHLPARPGQSLRVDVGLSAPLSSDGQFAWFGEGILPADGLSATVFVGGDTRATEWLADTDDGWDALLNLTSANAVCRLYGPDDGACDYAWLIQQAEDWGDSLPADRRAEVCPADLPPVPDDATAALVAAQEIERGAREDKEARAEAVARAEAMPEGPDRDAAVASTTASRTVSELLYALAVQQVEQARRGQRARDCAEADAWWAALTSARDELDAVRARAIRLGFVGGDARHHAIGGEATVAFGQLQAYPVDMTPIVTDPKVPEGELPAALTLLSYDASAGVRFEWYGGDRLVFLRARGGISLVNAVETHDITLCEAVSEATAVTVDACAEAKQLTANPSPSPGLYLEGAGAAMSTRLSAGGVLPGLSWRLGLEDVFGAGSPWALGVSADGFLVKADNPLGPRAGVGVDVNAPLAGGEIPTVRPYGYFGVSF